MSRKTMIYSLFYFEGAKKDVREAKAWYNEQKHGLGKQFASSIKEAIIKLQKNPLAYGVRYKNVRVAHPKTFPYSIHFYLEGENKIVIFAIVHNKRHPDVAIKRDEK